MTAKLPIYLDHHATTPVDPRVLRAMLPYFCEKFGNASSRSHQFGWEAEAAVEKARELVAELIGATSTREIVFTSGATEANNLALKGVAEQLGETGHLVTTAVEHRSVLDVTERLSSRGWEVTVVGVDRRGRVDADAIDRALTDRTRLVSVMLANNEVGTIQPIGQIGKRTRARGVLLHVDAVQGVGRTGFDVNDFNVDLCSLSAHKIGGPKGVGALYVRRSNPRVRLLSQIDGGGHERGLRSGTLDVPGIVGFGCAADLLGSEGAGENQRLAALRDRLEQWLVSELDGVSINGDVEHRLPNNLNLSFDDVSANALMLRLPEIALSSGSACSSATPEPSHVLKAMGIGADRLLGSLRFGLGRDNDNEQVEYVASRIIEEVRNLRSSGRATDAGSRRSSGLE